MKNYHEIIERLHYPAQKQTKIAERVLRRVIEGTSAVSLNLHWMTSGGQILWNAFPFSEMSKISVYSRTKIKWQNVFDGESRSDLSFTEQKDTRWFTEGKKEEQKSLLLEGESVSILGNTLTEGFGQQTLRTWHQEESRVTRCATLTNTSEDGGTKTHVRVNRRTDRRCACATADFERDRLSDEAGPTWTRTNDAENSWISPAAVHNKYVDDGVKVQRQVPQSKWRWKKKKSR